MNELGVAPENDGYLPCTLSTPRYIKGDLTQHFHGQDLLPTRKTALQDRYNRLHIRTHSPGRVGKTSGISAICGEFRNAVNWDLLLGHKAVSDS